MAFTMTFRALSGAANSGSTVTLDRPTGTEDGDILTIFIFDTANPYTLDTDGDMHGFVANNPVSNGLRIFQKIADSEPASWTFDIEPDTGQGGSAGPGESLYATCFCWQPGELGFNESYPSADGPGWLGTGLDGSSYNFLPSPTGHDNTGDEADTSTRKYLAVVAAIGQEGRTLTDGAHSPNNFDSYSGTYDALVGTEVLMGNVDFGSGFQTQWRWSKWAYKETGGFQFLAEVSGLVGSAASEPGFSSQAYITLDPDFVDEEIPSEAFGGFTMESQTRRVNIQELPYQVSSSMLRRRKR